MPCNTGIISSSYRRTTPGVDSLVLDASDLASLLNVDGQPIADGAMIGSWRDMGIDRNTEGRKMKVPKNGVAPIYDATRKGVSFRNGALLSAAYDTGCPRLLGNSVYCVFSIESNNINGAAGMISRSSVLAGGPFSTTISASTILGTTMQCIAHYSTPDGLGVPGRFATKSHRCFA